MFLENGMFVPSHLPEADRLALEKYHQGRPLQRYGLGDRIALLVVDMTRGFVEDRFPSGWSATGIPCARSIETLLAEARALALPIFFTRPARMTAPVELGRWSRRPDGEVPAHLIDEYYEFYDGLEPLPGEIAIEKQKPSAFFGTPLHAMLTWHRVDTVLVTGMVTSGCVRATINDAFSCNFRTVVPVECVADRSQLSHEVELWDVGQKYADVLPLATLLQDLAAWADRTGLARVARS